MTVTVTITAQTFPKPFPTQNLKMYSKMMTVTVTVQTLPKPLPNPVQTLTKSRPIPYQTPSKPHQTPTNFLKLKEVR